MQSIPSQKIIINFLSIFIFLSDSILFILSSCLQFGFSFLHSIMFLDIFGLFFFPPKYNCHNNVLHWCCTLLDYPLQTHAVVIDQEKWENCYWCKTKPSSHEKFNIFGWKREQKRTLSRLSLGTKKLMEAKTKIADIFLLIYCLFKYISVGRKKNNPNRRQ